MAWQALLLMAFVGLLAAFLFLAFKGNRQKAERDIEDRLSAIEALVEELTGEDFSRPLPKEISIRGEAVPTPPRRPSALRASK